MGVLGKRPDKGLTKSELEKKQFGSSSAKSRMRSSLSGSRTSVDRKMQSVMPVLEQALDADRGSVGRGTIKPEEFDNAMESLVRNKKITENDAQKMRSAIEDDLND